MPLSADQIEHFHGEGYLVFRRLASAAICEAMLKITDDHLQHAVPPVEYEAEVGYPGAPQSVDAPGGRTIRRLRAACQRDEVFRVWATDPFIAGALQQLLDERVCLTLAHHNCVMTKHPGYGTATGWHRDIRYWSYARNALVSVWLALGRETESNGALKIIPGSHRIDVQRSQLDDLDFLRPEVEENRAIVARGKTVELEQGDVLFFHSGLFHAAGRNESGQVKKSVVFAYRGLSNPPAAGSRSAAAGEVLLGD